MCRDGRWWSKPDVPDIVLYRSGKPWSTPIEEAFAAGLARHGITPEHRGRGQWRKSDLAVIWAHQDEKLFQIQRESGAHYLVMERGYIGDIHNRRKYTSLGFDGLNGRARFPEPRDPDRWRRLMQLHPWRIGGDYVLVMGQVRGDAAVAGVDLEGWYEATARRIAMASGLPVRFRPHPQSVERYEVRDVPGTERSTGTLEQALDGAAAVATYSSNSGVDAVLAGVPVWACDEGSMVKSIAGRDLDEMPPRPDRTEWANRIAHAQWENETEIAGGVAWDHLKELLCR